jgi:hypothetical protein
MARNRDVTAVRILPMSIKRRGFESRSIEDVQQRLFLRDLPRSGGRWTYPRVGLSADPGTIVLFQYRARVIATAVFLRDEKFERPRNGSGGAMHFDPATIRTFDPLDVEAMRKAWPSFRAFGHVRQFLNPARYPMFKRRLKNVASPAVGRTRAAAGKLRPSG